jgi:hypothetical protein
VADADARRSQMYRYEQAPMELVQELSYACTAFAPGTKLGSHYALPRPCARTLLGVSRDAAAGPDRGAVTFQVWLYMPLSLLLLLRSLLAQESSAVVLVRYCACHGKHVMHGTSARLVCRALLSQKGFLMQLASLLQTPACRIRFPCSGCVLHVRSLPSSCMALLHARMQLVRRMLARCCPLTLASCCEPPGVHLAAGGRAGGRAHAVQAGR